MSRAPQTGTRPGDFRSYLEALPEGVHEIWEEVNAFMSMNNLGEDEALAQVARICGFEEPDIGELRYVVPCSVYQLNIVMFRTKTGRI
jgi:hypothetical protein